MRIIDLSQEIYAGMPVFDGHQEVRISTAVSQQPDAPSALSVTLGDHSGTHVDAFNHFSTDPGAHSIDEMPLGRFITAALCLDFSHKGLMELIEHEDVTRALDSARIAIEPGDTILLYTDHYRRHFGTEAWPDGPGVSAELATWFGEKRIAAFGVETRSAGVRKVSNKAVHRICGQMGYTHYENLVNLHELVGIGRFRFIGLPLKIRGGTGSPVRAVAVIE